MSDQPENYIDLRWRDRVQRETMIFKLADLLVKFDINKTYEVRRLTSTAKKVVTVADPSMNYPLVRQEKKTPTVKKWKPDNTQHEGSLYCVRMNILIERIMQDLDSSSLLASRNLQYSVKFELFSFELAKEMVHDLAITINEHPYNLGWLPDSKAEVLVPTGITITMDVMEDIFQYMDSKRPKCQKITGDHFDIPLLITRIRVTWDEGCNVRAVIVCEHRNLRSVFKRMTVRMSGQGCGGLLVVMTGGSRDQSCGEFLHILGKCPELEGVPFIFISDSNPEALTLFANLKYGSLSLAHLSTTLCCPRLLYGGVTLQDLEDIMNSYPNRKLARIAGSDNWTEQEKSQALRSLARDARRIVEAVKKTRIPVTRRKKLVGLRKRRLFETDADLTARAELDRMLQRNSCMFNMQELGKLESAGYMYLFREVVARARNERLEDIGVDEAYYSQSRAHLHNSQMSEGQRIGSDQMLPNEVNVPEADPEVAPEKSVEERGAEVRAEVVAAFGW